jgi:predicted choloylglycine hydrolase
VTGPSFGVPLVVRYLLEGCETTDQAMRTLARLPVQASYNLTILDRVGQAVTSCIAPDRPPRTVRAAAATNHQHGGDWPEHAQATRTFERERRILALLRDAETREPDVVAAFLSPPLRSTAYAAGFGTLYTALHRPAQGAVEYHWPGVAWRQSFDAFEEGARVVTLAAEAASAVA